MAFESIWYWLLAFLCTFRMTHKRRFQMKRWTISNELIASCTFISTLLHFNQFYNIKSILVNAIRSCCFCCHETIKWIMKLHTHTICELRLSITNKNNEKKMIFETIMSRHTKSKHQFDKRNNTQQCCCCFFFFFQFEFVLRNVLFVLTLYLWRPPQLLFMKWKAITW